MRLPAYVSDNYSHASQIGTGFILSDRDPSRPLACRSFEVVVKSRLELSKERKKRKGKYERRKEDREAGREQSRSLKGIERKMAVNSGCDFPGYDKKRDTIPIDRPTRTRTWQRSLFKSNNALFSFFLFTVRQPTLTRIKGKRDKTCSETFRSINRSSGGQRWTTVARR